MKISKSAWGIWMLMILLGWSACTPDPSCNDIYIPAVLAGFYQLDEEGNVVRDTLYFDSVFAEGVNADTFLVDRQDTVFTHALFVNPQADTTTYFFCIADSCNQITLMYDRREFLLSPECGPRFRYQNLRAQHDFDSISILKTELTLVGDINIQIFR